jgi:hypothetical protein
MCCQHASDATTGHGMILSRSHVSSGSSVVSLYSMYRLGWVPSAAYHCGTYGAIQMASPACTGYLHVDGERVDQQPKNTSLSVGECPHDDPARQASTCTRSHDMRACRAPCWRAVLSALSRQALVSSSLGLCQGRTSGQQGGRCPVLAAAAARAGCSAPPADASLCQSRSPVRNTIS